MEPSDLEAFLAKVGRPTLEEYLRQFGESAEDGLRIRVEWALENLSDLNVAPEAIFVLDHSEEILLALAREREDLARSRESEPEDPASFIPIIVESARYTPLPPSPRDTPTHSRRQPPQPRQPRQPARPTRPTRSTPPGPARRELPSSPFWPLPPRDPSPPPAAERPTRETPPHPLRSQGPPTPTPSAPAPTPTPPMAADEAMDGDAATWSLPPGVPHMADVREQLRRVNEARRSRSRRRRALRDILVAMAASVLLVVTTAAALVWLDILPAPWLGGEWRAEVPVADAPLVEDPPPHAEPSDAVAPDESLVEEALVEESLVEDWLVEESLVEESPVEWPPVEETVAADDVPEVVPPSPPEPAPTAPARPRPTSTASPAAPEPPPAPAPRPRRPPAPEPTTAGPAGTWSGTLTGGALTLVIEVTAAGKLSATADYEDRGGPRHAELTGAHDAATDSILLATTSGDLALMGKLRGDTLSGQVVSGPTGKWSAERR